MKLNQPVCASNYGNTGFGDCFIEPSKFVGGFQVPKNFEIGIDDIDDLQTYLRDKVSSSIGSRIFPYHDWISVTDNTEDVSITTTDYGAKYITRDGFYDFSFRYLKGGVALHQEIAKNAGSGKSFLFYDDQGVLYGYKSEGKLKGIPVDIFYVNPWRLPTGADAAGYTLRYIINPKYLNQGNLGYVKTDFNLFDIQGLEEVQMNLLSQVSNAATVELLSKISGVNLYDAFGATLANVLRWQATVRSTGAIIALTTVVVNSGLKALVFTINSAAFNALDPSDAVIIKGKDAADWDSAGVVGYEAHDGLVIEVPGS